MATEKNNITRKDRAKLLVRRYNQIVQSALPVQELKPEHTKSDDLGDLSSIMQELIRAYSEDGIPGMYDAINAVCVIDRDISAAYAGFDMRTLEASTEKMSQTGQSAEPEKKRTLINFADLRNRPRPKWVIQDFIYEGTIIELYAEAGCYKSFLAFDWAARIATGTDWLGHIKTHKSGKVVYIAAEGADGYISRGDAWCFHNNIPFDDLAHNFFFWPDSLPLTNTAEVARFIDEVNETLSGEENTPQLIVIDTLLRCADGQNINAPDVMGSIFMGAAKIKAALNVPNILIVHHAGKNAQLGGMGSVVLKNNCDCIYFMSKNAGTPGQVVLKAEKMKDKAEPQIILRSEKVYYGDMWDEENASLVLAEGEISDTEVEKVVPDTQIALLDIIRDNKEIGFTELYKKWHVEGLKGYSEENYKKILRKLITDKQVEKIGEGKNARYRLYIVPKTEQLDMIEENDSEESND